MISGRDPPTFEESVFLNCPFDAEYAPLFRAMVRTTPHTICALPSHAPCGRGDE